MAILPVCTWGNPILKKRTKEIGQITDKIRQLSLDMFDTLHSFNGVGLAANQVGFSERVFIVEVPSQVGPPVQHTILNPVLAFSSRTKQIQEEGCLSFPEIYGPVERAAEVEIQGVDLEGKPICVRASGLLGRALQHEMDHLNGIVFTERMNVVHRLTLNRPLRELEKITKNGMKFAPKAKKG